MIKVHKVVDWIATQSPILRRWTFILQGVLLHRSEINRGGLKVCLGFQSLSQWQWPFLLLISTYYTHQGVPYYLPNDDLFKSVKAVVRARNRDALYLAIYPFSLPFKEPLMLHFLLVCALSNAFLRSILFISLNKSVQMLIWIIWS